MDGDLGEDASVASRGNLGTLFCSAETYRAAASGILPRRARCRRWPWTHQLQTTGGLLGIPLCSPFRLRKGRQHPEHLTCKFELKPMMVVQLYGRRKGGGRYLSGELDAHDAEQLHPPGPTKDPPKSYQVGSNANIQDAELRRDGLAIRRVAPYRPGPARWRGPRRCRGARQGALVLPHASPWMTSAPCL